MKITNTRFLKRTFNVSNGRIERLNQVNSYYNGRLVYTSQLAKCFNALAVTKKKRDVSLCLLIRFRIVYYLTITRRRRSDYC